jgi:integrase
VQAWVSRLAAGRSASTARKAHRVLSLILSLAVRDGRLVKNPADGVGLPRETQKDRLYLTHEQVRELAAACADPSASVTKRRSERGHASADYQLSCSSWLTPESGSVRWLRCACVGSIRWSGGVEIAEAVTSVNGALVWGTPKGHARRWVSVPRFIAGQLGEHVAGRAPDDLVFTSPQGEPLRASNFRRDVFTPATRQVGLEDLVPHGLRHTAASLAIAAGADVKVVQQMLGHKSATMTLDLYGHLFDGRLDEVADALDRAAHSSERAQRGVVALAGTDRRLGG